MKTAKQQPIKRRLIFLTVLLLAPLAALHAAETTPASKLAKRPAFHFTPPAGWMNDPNGLVYHDGEYHLYYQSFPDDIQRPIYGEAGDLAGARISWGHAVSRDLVAWQHLPVAIPEEISGNRMAAIYSVWPTAPTAAARTRSMPVTPWWTSATASLAIPRCFGTGRRSNGYYAEVTFNGI
jgi:hypothetical protein